MPSRDRATRTRASCAPRSEPIRVDRGRLFFVGIIARTSHRRVRTIGIARAGRRGAAVPRRRDRPEPAQSERRSAHPAPRKRPYAGDGGRTLPGNRRLLVKLAVIVVAMFGFGYALVPFYDEICRGDRPARHRPAGRGRRTRRSTRRAPCASNSTPTCASCRGSSAPLQRIDRRASGRGDAGGVRSRQHHRPPDHRTGDSELRPAVRRAVFPQARMLLLHAADARAGRDAADAGRVRRRSEAAEADVARSRCRTRSSRSRATATADALPVAASPEPSCRNRGAIDERSLAGRHSPTTSFRSPRTGRSPARARCCSWASARRSGSTVTPPGRGSCSPDSASCS